MRWLMIALLASLGALLLAAAGLVRHIWIQRAKSAQSLPRTPESTLIQDLARRKKQT